MKVKCPQCKKETEYSPTNPNRPFCSDRCKLIDLGDWADGKFRMPSEEPLTEEDLENITNQLVNSDSDEDKA